MWRAFLQITHLVLAMQCCFFVEHLVLVLFYKRFHMTQIKNDTCVILVAFSITRSCLVFPGV